MDISRGRPFEGYLSSLSAKANFFTNTVVVLYAIRSSDYIVQSLPWDFQSQTNRKDITLAQTTGEIREKPRRENRSKCRKEQGWKINKLLREWEHKIHSQLGDYQPRVEDPLEQTWATSTTEQEQGEPLEQGQN